MTSEIIQEKTDERCPWGHPVDFCGYLLMKRCRVRRAQNNKARRDKLINEGLFLSRKRGRPVGAVGKKPKPLNKSIGRVSEKSYYNKPIPIQLVCGHDVYFQRNHISNKYSRTGQIATNDSELWCSRCRDMIKIHQINGTHKGDLALVVWPLEVPETDPPKYRLATKLNSEESTKKGWSTMGPPDIPVHSLLRRAQKVG